MSQLYPDHFKYCPNCGASLPDITQDMDSITCSACGFTIYFNPSPAVGVIITKDNKLLLAQRKFKPFAGDWDLPGGFVDIGESPQQASVRELKEEADLEIKVLEYISAYPDRYQQYPTLVMGFSAEIISGEIEPHDDVAKLKWFSINKLPDNIAFASINRIIKDFLNSN